MQMVTVHVHRLWQADHGRQTVTDKQWQANHGRQTGRQRWQGNCGSQLWQIAACTYWKLASLIAFQEGTK